MRLFKLIFKIMSIVLLLAVVFPTGETDAAVNPGLTAQVFKIEGESSVNHVLLKWEADSSVKEYRIYRAESKADLTSVEPIKVFDYYTNNYEEYGLPKKDAVYYYQVRGYKNDQLVYSTCTATVQTYAKLKEGLTITHGWADSTNEGVYWSGSVSNAAAARAADQYSYSLSTSNKQAVLRQTNHSTGEVIRNILGYNNGVTLDAYPELADCKFEALNTMTHPVSGRIIIWAHYEKSSDYATGALVCFSVEPGKPETLYYSGLVFPNGKEARDKTVYTEGNDAYLIVAGNEKGKPANSTMYIHKLNAAWNGVDETNGPVATLFDGLYREAPTMVKVNGSYYLFTSQAAGWLPSQGAYSYADSLNGPWSELKVPTENSTFSSQQNGVVTTSGNGQTSYLLNGYRWWRSSGTGGRTLMPLTFNGGYATADFFENIYWGDGIVIPERSGRVISTGKKAVMTAGGKSVDATESVDGDYNTRTIANHAWPAEWVVDLETEYEL